MEMRPGKRTWAVSSAMIAIVAMLVPLVLAGRAEAYIYWAMSFENNIGRANLDGTNGDRGFIRGVHGPLGVAVDSDHIYWAAIDSDSIGRATIDGSHVEKQFVPLGSDPRAGVSDVAVTAEHLYWTRDDGDGFARPASSWIGRANIDGSGVEEHFIYAGQPVGIAVDDSHIYWTDHATYSVGRANLDGTDVTQLITGSSDTWFTGIAVGADQLYWADEFGSIGRSDLDGGGVEPSFIRRTTYSGLAVDADHIYWGRAKGCLYAVDCSSSIARANLDGSGIEKDFLTNVGAADGMAVDGLYRRDTKRPQTRIKTPKTTVKRDTVFRLTSSQPVNQTFDCKLDKERWKPCETRAKLKGLKKGQHKFQARASDAAGNTDPTPASDKFKVVP